MSSRRSSSERAVRVAALAVVLSLPCSAQMGPWEHETLLTASDGSDGGDLGSSVTLAGNTAVVGGGKTALNAVYVYLDDGAGWTQEARLQGSSTNLGDDFGASCSLSGDTLAVGARWDGIDGRAFVFVRAGGTWTEEARLEVNVPGIGRFGTSVSVSGDTLVVGAPGEENPGQSAGAAYVFERTGSTWNQTARLEAGVPSPSDEFGSSVAIDAGSSTIAVGSPGDDGPRPDNGATYVFVLDAGLWVQQARLVGPDPAADAEYGRSVDLEGETLLVGAPGAIVGGVRRGAAYVSIRSGITWSLQGTLASGSGAGVGDRCGESVGLSGDTAIVGVPGDDGPAGADQGTVRFFTRTGSTWGGEVVKVGSNPEGNAKLGAAVAVDGDGAVLAAFRPAPPTGYQGSAAAYVRVGTNWVEEDVFAAVDSDDVGFFGGSVSFDGDTAVVGASSADGSEFSSGAAYVFVRSGTLWTEQQKLGASDAEALQDFGCSVAVSGDTLVVGNIDDDLFGTESGAAYVFERVGTQWSEVVKLFPSDAEPEDYFGWAADIDGDTLVIGAPELFESNQGVGSAYVFVRNGNTWMEQAKLVPSDGAFSDNFGLSVAVDGETVIVGSVGHDAAGSGSGAAYVYVRQGTSWTEQAKLEAEDAQALANFGSSVAVSGDSVAVGARRDPTLFPDAGTAYVFVRTGSSWEEQARLDTASAAAGDWRGVVALEGDVLLSASSNAAGAGNAAVFVRNGTMWAEQALLSAADGEPGEGFAGQAGSVSVSGDTILVGSDFDGFGSVSVFRRVGGSWADLGGGTAGAAGTPSLVGSGLLTAGSTAGLQVDAAPPNALLLAWISFAPVPQAFEGGTLHAFPFANQLLFVADGGGSLLLSTTWPAGVPPGTSAWFQFLVQDASVPVGLTLSNGVLAVTP